jgi:hypothetical protein
MESNKKALMTQIYTACEPLPERHKPVYRTQLEIKRSTILLVSLSVNGEYILPYNTMSRQKEPCQPTITNVQSLSVQMPETRALGA